MEDSRYWAYKKRRRLAWYTERILREVAVCRRILRRAVTSDRRKHLRCPEMVYSSKALIFPPLLAFLLGHISAVTVTACNCGRCTAYLWWKWYSGRCPVELVGRVTHNDYGLENVSRIYVSRRQTCIYNSRWLSASFELSATHMIASSWTSYVSKLTLTWGNSVLPKKATTTGTRTWCTHIPRHGRRKPGQVWKSVLIMSLFGRFFLLFNFLSSYLPKIFMCSDSSDRHLGRTH